MYENVVLLSGLPSMKADVVSANGYGFGGSRTDGQPLGGRPPLARGPVQDVTLLARPRGAGYIPGATDYASVIASSAGAGSVEGIRFNGLGAGFSMPTKWWQWALLGGAVYFAWTRFGK